MEIFLSHKKGCNSKFPKTIQKGPAVNSNLSGTHISELIVEGNVASIDLPVLKTAIDSNNSYSLGKEFYGNEEEITHSFEDHIDDSSNTEPVFANTPSDDNDGVIIHTKLGVSLESPKSFKALLLSEEKIDTENVELVNHVTKLDKVETSRSKDCVATKRKTKKQDAFKKFYICSSCDFVTLYPNDLTRHTRKHTGERPFECSICKQRFARKDKLQTHFRTHTGDKPYKCQLCDYAAVSICPLRKHLRTHTDERPYKCQFCVYSARDSSQLTVHLRRHTGDAPFICLFSNCGKAFKTNTDLKRHKNIHTKKQFLVCKHCEFRASCERSLEAHNRLHHDHEELKCSIENCMFTTNDEGEFIIHKKSHDKIAANNSPDSLLKCKFNSRHQAQKNHSCKLCDEADFKTNTSKSKTKKRHKKNRGNMINSSLFQKTLQCTYCSLSFVRQDSLRCHMKQHQSSSTQVEPNPNTSDQVLKNHCSTSENQRSIEEASSFFIDDLNSQETLEYSNGILKA